MEKYTRLGFAETSTGAEFQKLCDILKNQRRNAMQCSLPMVDEFSWGMTRFLGVADVFAKTSSDAVGMLWNQLQTRFHDMDVMVLQDLRALSLYGVALHLWIVNLWSAFEVFAERYRLQKMGMKVALQYLLVHDSRSSTSLGRAYDKSGRVGQTYVFVEDDCDEESKRRYVKEVDADEGCFMVRGFPIRDGMSLLTSEPSLWTKSNASDIQLALLKIRPMPEVQFHARMEKVRALEKQEYATVRENFPGLKHMYKHLVLYRRYISKLMQDDHWKTNNTSGLPITASMPPFYSRVYDFDDLMGCAKDAKYYYDSETSTIIATKPNS
jgi:hypothetical protein